MRTPEVGVSYLLRDGKSVRADAVFHAWTSGDLVQMLSVFEIQTNPIDRHHLLQGIVKATYSRRSEPEMRRICSEVAERHLAEIRRILPVLVRDLGVVPRVTTFQHYSTLLEEDGRFEEAISVCRMALELGLKDGTKSGFEGRIGRIQVSAKRNKT